jgi:hypothetical protein
VIIDANKYEESYFPIFPNMDSAFAVSITTGILGQKRAHKAIHFYQLNNCSSDINATNNCCDMTDLAINTFVGCGIRRIFTIIYI